MSKKLAKTLVWKYDYDVKLWRHKQRTPNINDHHMPLNEIPPWKFSAYATADSCHGSLMLRNQLIWSKRNPRSVLPGFKVTMRFYFNLWLVLVTSDCEITTECGVDKSVNTSIAHVIKKHSSGAGAISFLQKLHSPDAYPVGEIYNRSSVGFFPGNGFPSIDRLYQWSATFIMVAQNALSVAIKSPCLFLKAQFKTYAVFGYLLHSNAMLMW